MRLAHFRSDIVEYVITVYDLWFNAKRRTKVWPQTMMLGLGVRAKIVAKLILSGAESQAPLFTSSLLG